MKFGRFFKKVQTAVFGEASDDEPRAETAVTSQLPVAVTQAAVPIPAAKPSSPRKSSIFLDSSIKEQGEWLFQKISETGKLFFRQAEDNGLIVSGMAARKGGLERHDVTAMMLGFKLVTTAYRIHQETPSREVLRVLRSAVMAMLLQAIKENVMEIERTKASDTTAMRRMMLENAEAEVRNADAEITEVIGFLQAHSAKPFVPFYTKLALSFDVSGATAEWDAKFGQLIKDLYVKIDDAIGKQSSQATG